MAHGVLEQAEHVLKLSQGGKQRNTAFSERLNGTIQARLASLTRKRRYAAIRFHSLHTGIYLISYTSHFWLLISNALKIRIGERYVCLH